MDDLHGTLGYSRRKGSKNLRELASGDYLTFGALIWRGKLTGLTLLLLTGSETIVFGVGSLGIGIRCTHM